MLTTPEVNEIMASAPAQEGQKALVEAEKCTDTSQLTVSQYAAARDFIIMAITRNCGTRPGALETVTLGQWRAARWDNDETSKVILVTSHKREVEAPAPIPCNREIVRWIEVFVAKLRPLLADDSSNSGKLFLKSDGAPYPKGTISRCITAFVLKSGVRADRPISATDFRKWLVTAMKAKKRAGLSIDEDLLRRLMCHSEQTAHTW